MLFVVEESHVSKHLEFVHHVVPVDVQAVDVVDQSRNVLRHRRQFRSGEVVPGLHAISLPPNKITLFGRFF